LLIAAAKEARLHGHGRKGQLQAEVLWTSVVSAPLVLFKLCPLMSTPCSLPKMLVNDQMISQSTKGMRVCGFWHHR
jgi:hypothetical protein